MGREQADRHANAGRLPGLRQGLDFTSFRTRWMAALSGLSVLAAMLWIATYTSQDDQLHRLGVEAELAGITRELAGTLDGDALVPGAAFEIVSPGERLEQLDGIARVEPAASSPMESGNPQKKSKSAVASLGNTGELAGVLTVTAPIVDSFGAVAGVLRVVAPSQRPLLHRLGRLGLLGILFGGLLTLLLKGADLALKNHCEALDALADGRTEDAIGRYSSRELCRLTLAIDQRTSAGAAPASDAADDWIQSPGPQPAMLSESALAPATPSLGEVEVPYHPGLLVEETVQGFSREALNRGVELSLWIGDRVPPTAEGRPGEIGDALQALIQSAMKSASRGTVLVRVSREPNVARLRFEVRDTGKGLTAREQEELRRNLDLGTFSTERNALEGAFLAHSIARSLGGQLEFDSHLGAGSRFWFTIPYSPVAALPTNSKAAVGALSSW